MNPASAMSWSEYRDIELAKARPLLARHGFILDEQQVHIGGERSVISGRKLVLLGKRAADNRRVVIKIETKIEQRTADGLAVHRHVALGQMPAARAHDEHGKIFIVELVGFACASAKF